ncbi:hypothetical protein A3860_37835 [Niastella vici]|uniref:Uncharacterized protein n=1 Tax=Niastella vici TaxID=1703345 RepID=A0A1V9FMA3_9BACT|nr:hypothetical protein A3860_37835 [Niastella vici]
MISSISHNRYQGYAFKNVNVKNVMNTKKLFKQLKNGNLIELLQQSDSLNYTIHLTFKNGVFSLHSYHFAGNDVFDESNYQNEQIENFNNFQDFLKRLIEKFPDITYP